MSGLWTPDNFSDFNLGYASLTQEQHCQIVVSAVRFVRINLVDSAANHLSTFADLFVDSALLFMQSGFEDLQAAIAMQCRAAVLSNFAELTFSSSLVVGTIRRFFKGVYTATTYFLGEACLRDRLGDPRLLFPEEFEQEVETLNGSDVTDDDMTS